VGNYDRRLYREGWGDVVTIEVDVHGNVEVDKGDLLFLDQTVGLRDRGTSAADYYAYPFSKVSGSTLTLASNKTLAANNFIGVAAWHSESGVTEKVSVHIEGLFKYPLKNTRTVKVGYFAAPAGSGTTLYNQVVTVMSGSSGNIGKAVRSGNYQAEVEFVAWTMFNIAHSELIRDNY